MHERVVMTPLYLSTLTFPYPSQIKYHKLIKRLIDKVHLPLPRLIERVPLPLPRLIERVPLPLLLIMKMMMMSYVMKPW